MYLKKIGISLILIISIISIKYININKHNYIFNIKYNNLDRRYKLYVPKNYNIKNKVPLVIIFHGGGGNINNVEKYFEFNKLAEKENFIIAYPEGTGIKIGQNLLGTWNGGDCCGYAKDNNIDDIGFIKKMLSEIKTNFNINKNQIFATGMSNGAIITYRLACELSQEIASIAVVGSINNYKDCHPKRPIPILHIHGLNDPCAPYNGCTECTSCIQNYLSILGFKTKYRRSSSISVIDYINKWKQINHCSDKTKITYKKDDALCKKYLNCTDNSDIILCTVKNMGHVWPGKKEYGANVCQQKPKGKLCSLWKKIVGKTNTDIPANNLIWDFFKKHSLN